jgi:hypothetical protein
MFKYFARSVRRAASGFRQGTQEYTGFDPISGMHLAGREV